MRNSVVAPAVASCLGLCLALIGPMAGAAPPPALLSTPLSSLSVPQPLSGSGSGAPTAEASGHALSGLLAQAWARQPLAQAASAHQRAAQARQAASQHLWAGAPAVWLQAMGEGAGRSAGAGGARELEAGVAWPLWRPGEQARAQQLASAGLQRSQARTLAEHWQLAGSLREAWWAVWRAQADRQAAQARLQGLRALQADVARRVAAGDLARADGHQAAMAVAQAEAGLAEAQARHDGALSSLLALTGGEMASVQPWLDAPVGPEPGMPPAPATPSGAEPDAPAWQAVPEAHPAHALARAQSAEAAAQAEWQAVAADAPPELTLSGTRGREGLGEAERQTFTVGLRWPLGEAGEAPARRHQAHAERLEAEAAERHTVARLQADLTGARARWQAMAAHWQATQHQARLARESLGFWTRAFEWGQADLPTRLRAEQELHQADAALARARIEWWAAWSSWRQALGLLP